MPVAVKAGQVRRGTVRYTSSARSHAMRSTGRPPGLGSGITTITRSLVQRIAQPGTISSRPSQIRRAITRTLPCGRTGRRDRFDGCPDVHGETGCSTPFEL